MSGILRHVPEPMDPSSWADPLEYSFGLTRRGFVQVLGAGLMIAATVPLAVAQSRRGQGGDENPAARLHIGEDGVVTVLTGKVEGGQGARGQLAQAAAEELRVPIDHVRLVMGDTGMVPDDGITAGSRTTPSTMPAVRRAAAAARHVLVRVAAGKWGVDPERVEIREGALREKDGVRSIPIAELVRERDAELRQALSEPVPEGIEITRVEDWKVLGAAVSRRNTRDVVTGAHKFPSDLRRPGMLYGRVLRPESYGARLVEIDLAPARAMEGVVVVRDGDFVGVAAATSYRADKALEALRETARWESAPHPSSREVYDYLREHAEGGVPENPFAEAWEKAATRLRATYRVAYVQHAPMETRSALAEWNDGSLTVWTGTQNPFGHRRELARAFRLAEERVRVIVPDFGGGFGGKHSGEAAVEAARLALAAEAPVLLQWTRAEEFTWAYFRPAGVIECAASLDPEGRLATWYFVNVNSGRSAVDTPYRVPRVFARHVGSAAPLRQGSYRALASTANTFARESFMDEIAAEAGVDPLEFRLAHLEHPRLRPVLEEAAARFGWAKRNDHREPGIGFGMACGTEKGSYVAACAEVSADAVTGAIRVRRVTQVFECGPIVNPANLRAQVEGCILMGLGPTLREEMVFSEGRMRNPRFSRYHVPRMSDVPELDIHLMNRPDQEIAGAGETPIIAIAPAIANAVFDATGRRIRQMPIRFENA